MGAVDLKEVEKSFDGAVACSKINLSIEQGEFFTFLGPSGCGKTTLLRLIAGFVTPDSGAVFLDGKNITHIPPEKRNVGMVFQNYSLFPYMSVSRNIEYGLKIQKKSKKQRREKIARYIEMVSLAGFDDRNVAELSGGEQQRVALARSLAVEPSVLLLDEPLSNLDARLRDKMRHEIKSLQKKLGITTIFVTHDQTEALTLSDRIAVFKAGHVMQVGTPQEVYDAPCNSFVAGFVGETNLFSVMVEGETARLDGGLELQISESESGRKHISIRPQHILLSDTPIVAPNTVQGTLMERQLNGVWIESLVQVENIIIRTAELNTIGKKIMRSGSIVWVTLPKQAIRLLDD